MHYLGLGASNERIIKENVSEEMGLVNAGGRKFLISSCLSVLTLIDGSILVDGGPIAKSIK
jgi:hypothetical protein